MSKKDNWVRRFEVDETAKHKNGFTIYKITSVLFPISSPDVLSVVSVWKRYSEAQRLHASIKRLHAGLQLKGSCPALPTHSYFKRFEPEVIAERAQAIKSLLEFVAQHHLLFTSTDFVNFLQTGYPEPVTSTRCAGSIATIRSSLHLPVEETPPLEYITSDDDSRSPEHAHQTSQSIDETDYSRIPIYEAADVELPSKSIDHRLSPVSFESLNSLESIDSDLYEELEKVSVSSPRRSCVKKSVLPDLINFDAPSTSKFDDYHTMIVDNPNFGANSQSAQVNVMKESYSDSVSLSSNTNTMDSNTFRSSSRTSHSMLSLSNVDCKTKTEDSYVFEAGYVLNLAARYEDMQEYEKSFDCYKAGIEKMLIGVQADSDPHRRALIKAKTKKYLSYAENIYNNHLCHLDASLLPDRDSTPLQTPPISMLRRPYEDLALYRVLAVLGSSMMLVLHRGDQTCYAMKVVQKIPNNLTEFDEYFLKNTNETRKPILPTLVPYMVPLISYIETNNLIFLILAYAPGEKLLDYIKNYVKSTPNTPAREVNLENVFAEPKMKKFGDAQNSIIGVDTKNFCLETEKENLKYSEINNQNIKNSNNEDDFKIDNETNRNKIEEISSENNVLNSSNNNYTEKTENSNISDNTDISVTEMVRNSKALLQNVDRILNKSNQISQNEMREDTSCRESEGEKDVDSERESIIIKKQVSSRAESSLSNTVIPNSGSAAIPPSTVCQWAAEILTAVESLHNCGVVCRDLNPSNILLGSRGQVCLTYITGYTDYTIHMAKLRLTEVNLYIAPELYDASYCLRFNSESDLELERVCDYWSFGAILYELLCGVPLSYNHRSVFTSHTILQLPETLPLEMQSILTQLLTYEPTARLGSGPEGIAEIKRHPYFKHIDWQRVVDQWTLHD